MSAVGVVAEEVGVVAKEAVAVAEKAIIPKRKMFKKRSPGAKKKTVSPADEESSTPSDSEGSDELSDEISNFRSKFAGSEQEWDANPTTNKIKKVKADKTDTSLKAAAIASEIPGEASTGSDSGNGDRTHSLLSDMADALYGVKKAAEEVKTAIENQGNKITNSVKNVGKNVRDGIKSNNTFLEKLEENNKLAQLNGAGAGAGAKETPKPDEDKKDKPFSLSDLIPGWMKKLTKPLIIAGAVAAIGVAEAGATAAHADPIKTPVKVPEAPHDPNHHVMMTPPKSHNSHVMMTPPTRHGPEHVAPMDTSFAHQMAVNTGKFESGLDLDSGEEGKSTVTGNKVNALGMIAKDAGGWSYGIMGLHATQLGQFVKAHPELGLPAPNSPDFNKKWEEASKNPKMKEAQLSWYKTRQIDGTQSDLKKLGVSDKISNDAKTIAYFADRKDQYGDVGLENNVKSVLKSHPEDNNNAEKFVRDMAAQDKSSLSTNFNTALNIEHTASRKGLESRISKRLDASLQIGGKLSQQTQMLAKNVPENKPTVIVAPAPAPKMVATNNNSGMGRSQNRVGNVPSPGADSVAYEYANYFGTGPNPSA
jgi:hypothetical protein